MRHVWSYIHQVGDALTALTLGIALEEFTNLEEKHHKDRFRKLRLSPRQETNAEGTYRGNGHEEVLIEGITFEDSFPCLVQCFVTY